MVSPLSNKPIRGPPQDRGTWLTIVSMILLTAAIIMLMNASRSSGSHGAVVVVDDTSSGGKKVGSSRTSHGGGSVEFVKAKAKARLGQGHLLTEVDRLQKAITLIDSEVEKLSDRVDIAEPEPTKALVKPKAPQNTFPMQNLESHRDSIFVSVASFRDEECGPMMVDLFDKAKTPRNVYVGIVEQHAENDPPCMPDKFMVCQREEFCPSDHIKIRKVPPKEARGPTYGRYLAMLMHRGQRYFLMIDSHNRFIPHWDSELIRLLRSAPSKKPVLSHYPEAWRKEEGANFKFDRGSTSQLCKARFLDTGVLRLDATISQGTKKFFPQPWAAAGFLFAESQLLNEVPFDPHLDMLFDGEEILYSARMWTHGWDIFSPGKNTLYHFYYRQNSKKVWTEVHDWHPRQQKAIQRVQYLMKVQRPNSDELIVPHMDAPEHVTIENIKYGMGSARSLEDYYKYVGADLKERKLHKDFCHEPAVDPWDPSDFREGDKETD